MRTWDRLVLLVFPGSLEEYRKSRQIHLREMRRYRKQPQFLAGLLLFFGPLIYLVIASGVSEDWITLVLLLCLLIGEMCIRDTICEHYCLLLYRLGYREAPHPDSAVSRPGVSVRTDMRLKLSSEDDGSLIS
jgi:hypothetical protein